MTTTDLRVIDIQVLIPPSHVLHEFPCTDKAKATVNTSRKETQDIIHQRSDKLLVVVGPCSIHDPKAAIEYATRLKALKTKYADTLEIVMRTYFEKPRTTIGWKGLINDPDMDGSFKINKGLKIARELLLTINEMGLGTAVEFLDTISPQYTADLVTWGAIGARTTESQGHRELASGMSCPIGFKNGTSGDVKIAVDAIGASMHPHSFLGVTKAGIAGIVTTRGNEDCHIILRGGKTTNFDAESITKACALLKKANLAEVVMVDASHSNSQKVCRNQITVTQALAEQIATGSKAIMGIMIESNLVEGRQNAELGKSLVYGQSVTDACIGWKDTEMLMATLNKAVLARRAL